MKSRLALAFRKIFFFYHFVSFFVDQAPLNGSGEIPHLLFHEQGLRIGKATFFKAWFNFFNQKHCALPFRGRRRAIAVDKKGFLCLLG